MNSSSMSIHAIIHIQPINFQKSVNLQWSEYLNKKQNKFSLLTKWIFFSSSLVSKKDYRVCCT